MTEQTEHTPPAPSEDGALPLPGLEPEPAGRQVQDLERAVRRTIVELHKQGHVREVDAGKTQLALELADIIAIKKATRRASTIGNDARVLMEILDSYIDEATDVDDGLRDAMAEWSSYVEGSRPAVLEDGAG